jgi:hypothetical protein
MIAALRLAGAMRETARSSAVAPQARQAGTVSPRTSSSNAGPQAVQRKS